VTDEGIWGDLPPPYVPPEPPRGGAGWQWWIGALLVVLVSLWLVALTLSQLTSREVAMPAVERGVAALSEVDALLQLHGNQICAQVDAGVPIEIPGFAVQGVTLHPQEVRCPNGELDRANLRALLVAQGAEQVYLRGTDAFREDTAAASTGSILSASGAIRLVLDNVGADMNERISVLVFPLGLLCLLVGVGFLLLGRGLGRFIGLGWVLVVSAFPMLMGVLLMWGVLSLVESGPDNSLMSEFQHITRSLIGLPLRNALYIIVAGFAIAIPAWAVRRFYLNRRRYEVYDDAWSVQ
jgi:hypothetical protein